jgi:acyl-CoA thioesterase-1
LRRFVVMAATLITAAVLPMMAAIGAAAARPVSLVAFGDSLSAGYQLPADDAFPAQLQAALRAKGLDVTVANAGVSGDTAQAGLDRLDWSVPDGTDAVIVELGANDMLRGLDPATTEATLDTILTRLQARNIKVLFAGMYALRNLGPDYRKAFEGIYPALAKKHDVPLYPFFLDGVAQDPALKLPDGLHPNAKGVATIVERILPAAEALVRAAQKS